MANEFYYQVMGQSFGPVTGVQLREKAADGTITHDTFVCVNGDWVSASRLKGLFDESGHPMLAPANQSKATPSPRTPPPRGQQIPPVAANPYAGTIRDASETAPGKFEAHGSRASNLPPAPPFQVRVTTVSPKSARGWMVPIAILTAILGVLAVVIAVVVIALRGTHEDVSGPTEGVLDGQIFIVTEGRENIKLGLVSVYAIDADKIQAAIKAAQKQVADAEAKISGEIASLRKDLENAQQKASEAQRAVWLPRANAEKCLRKWKEIYDSCVKPLYLSHPSSSSMTAPSFNPQYDLFDWIRNRLESNMHTCEGRLPQISSICKSLEEAIAEDTDDVDSRKWLAENKKEEKQYREYVSRCPENLDKLKAVRSRYDDAKSAFFKAQSAASTAEDEAGKRDSTVRQLKSRIETLTLEANAIPRSIVDIVFANLPVAQETTKSDADGKFSLKIPSGSRVAIAARAERSTGGQKEKYEWLLWVSLKSGEQKKTIMLSNDNLVDEGSSDSVLTLPKTPK